MTQSKLRPTVLLRSSSEFPSCLHGRLQKKLNTPTSSLAFLEDYALPDTWRSVLLNTFDHSGPLLIEHLLNAIRHGYIDPCNFTVKDLQRYIPMKRDTIYNALAELKKVVLTKGDSSKLTSSMSKKPDKSRRYRLMSELEIVKAIMPLLRQKLYEKFYQIALKKLTERIEADPDAQTLSLLDVLLWLCRQQNALHRDAMRRTRAYLYGRYDGLLNNINEPHSTSLHDYSSLSSTHRYRAALLRSWVLQDGKFRKYRRQIGKLLGVGRSGTTGIYETAGLISKPQCMIEILPSEVNINRLETVQQVKQEFGFALPLVSDGIVTRHWNSPEGKALCQACWKAGKSVKLTIPLPSILMLKEHSPSVRSTRRIPAAPQYHPAAETSYPF